MSNITNTNWLESAKENFEDAVAEGDYNGAECVLKDIADAGFTKESVALATDLAQQIEADKLEDMKLDEIV